MTRPGKIRRERDSNPGSSAPEADALTTRPARRSAGGVWQSNKKNCLPSVSSLGDTEQVDENNTLKLSVCVHLDTELGCLDRFQGRIGFQSHAIATGKRGRGGGGGDWRRGAVSVGEESVIGVFRPANRHGPTSRRKEVGKIWAENNWEVWLLVEGGRRGRDGLGSRGVAGGRGWVQLSPLVDDHG